LYGKYLHSCRLVASIIFIEISQFIINPYNKDPIESNTGAKIFD